MGYSTSAPPSLVTKGIGGKGNKWYLEGTDSQATVNSSGYITNGGNLGMRVNDQVEYVKTDATPPERWVFNVVSVSSVAPGAVDLDNGVQIGGVGNSD